MALSVGDKAPDFSLSPAPGPDQISLSSFKGRQNVVVLFFPLAFSGVCTDEICQVAEDNSTWNELGAQVLGISVDSVFVTSRFAQETGAQFPILSDFNKEAMQAYDVMYEDFFGAKGVAKRSAFVVGRDGLIKYAWVTEDAGVMPDFDAIKAVLAELD